MALFLGILQNGCGLWLYVHRCPLNTSEEKRTRSLFLKARSSGKMERRQRAEHGLVASPGPAG